MRILDMQTFTALVRNRHFGRTAQELSTTQPAISSRLAALEQELGHKLVHRMGTEFRLTPEGEEVLQVFQQVLDNLDTLKTKLDNLQAKAPVLSTSAVHNQEHARKAPVLKVDAHNDAGTFVHKLAT